MQFWEERRTCSVDNESILHINEVSSNLTPRCNIVQALMYVLEVILHTVWKPNNRNIKVDYFHNCVLHWKRSITWLWQPEAKEFASFLRQLVVGKLFALSDPWPKRTVFWLTSDCPKNFKKKYQRSMGANWKVRIIQNFF